MELWQRGPGDEWTRTEARAGEELELVAIGCTFDVRSLHQDALGAEAPG